MREFFSQDAEEKKEEAQTVKGDYPLKKKKARSPPFTLQASTLMDGSSSHPDASSTPSFHPSASLQRQCTRYLGKGLDKRGGNKGESKAAELKRM